MVIDCHRCVRNEIEIARLGLLEVVASCFWLSLSCGLTNRTNMINSYSLIVNGLSVTDNFMFNSILSCCF